MVVIPGPVEFVMGSPPTEAGRQLDELQHRKRIGRSFALAATSVTVEQYRKFKPWDVKGELEQWTRTSNSPVIGLSWFQAVEYCNWLSKQEGLPESEWCYEPLQDPKAVPVLAVSSAGLLGGPLGPLAASCGLYLGRIDPVYKGGMKLTGNYLQRKGYRLPTEAEMKYGIRAGAITSRFFGETDELLEKYAWYQKNALERTWPVGRKKPNDLGLFDPLGNVFTWCQERYRRYPQLKGSDISEDKEDALVITNTDSRVACGGAWIDMASLLRSACRGGYVPAHSIYTGGFRLARTLELSSFTALPPTAEGGRK
jgi:formylglycine-generating enzyme required for sulfatase activity